MHAQQLYNHALSVNSDPSYTTDVAKFHAVLQEAAFLSGNDSQQFMSLTNEVFFGSAANSGTLEARLAVPNTTLALDQITFGDTGAAPIYQDGTANQLSFHYWAFVNLGYRKLGVLGDAAAIIHDNNLANASNPGGVSAEDYRLSVLGLQMGQALQNRTWTPQDFVDNFNGYVTTDAFNPVSAATIQALNLPPAPDGPNANP